MTDIPFTQFGQFLGIVDVRIAQERCPIPVPATAPPADTIRVYGTVYGPKEPKVESSW